MRLRGTDLRLSATDLSNFLGYAHRAALDLAAASGARKRLPNDDELLLEILWQRGLEHEKSGVCRKRDKAAF